MRASVLEKLLMAVADFVALFICFFVAYYVQFHTGWITDKFDTSKRFSEYAQAGVILNLGWMTLFLFAGLYRKWLLSSRILQVLRVLRTILFGIGLVLLALFGTEALAHIISPAAAPDYFLYGSRLKLVLYYGLGASILVSALRIAIHIFMQSLLRHGYGSDNLLVLGVTERGAEITKELEQNPQLGHRVVGFVDEKYLSLPSKEFLGKPVLGKYSDLPELIRNHSIAGIIIGHESSSHREILRVLSWVAERNLHIYVVPDLYAVISGHFKTNDLYGIELQELFAYNMPPWQVQVKRFMDISVAASLLLFTLPITLFAAIAIKRTSKGPIFYTQERIGLYGKKFLVYKFRTMVKDAEKGGPQWASKNDSRITPIGKFLRKTRIDEIPQLWCVLKGDMSMVGPRPEREHFIQQLRDQIPLYISRLKMKPGLTGWAQVKHHYDTSIEDVQKKLKYDLYYFENMSLLLDLQILIRTVFVVITGKGAQ